MLNWFIGSIEIEKIHPLECGFVRLKYRRDRRPGLPIESVLSFYPRFLWEVVSKQFRWLWLWGRQYRLYRAIKADRKRFSYMDQALTPVIDDEAEERELFNTAEAKAFVSREKHLVNIRTGTA